MNDSSARTVPRVAPNGNRWLLLIHSIPPKPDYFRVKIGRRLQRIGAVAIKHSVYVLPKSDGTYEDFEWLLREIVEGGGEASMCEASFVEGLSNETVETLFRQAREADYREIGEDAKRLLASLPPSGRPDADRYAQIAGELVRLKRRLGEVAAIDFFGAPSRTTVETVIAKIEAALRSRGKGEKTRTQEARRGREELHGRTWVTRRNVHVDRMASAWLIRRFIDPEARFKFVAPKGYRPAPGEIRFDMFEAEYTHEGDRCTFETLLARFGLDDPGLRALGEIVHVIDVKDAKFAREEAPGVEQLVAGIGLACDDDHARLERGAAMFDDLYAALAKRSRKRAGGVRKRRGGAGGK